MYRYLVLMVNADPFMGGDYQFYKNEKEMIADFKYFAGDITHIFNISNTKDLYDYYKTLLD